MSNKSKKRNPRPASPAPNALAAEATGSSLGFEFRGHRFELDLAAIDFNKAAFAINLAQRGTQSWTVQAELMFDAFEASVGADNMPKLYELAPDLFSSAEAQKEFWEAFAAVTIGGNAGESLAS
jgi:hypothetical protein